jgi:hypothetical protein
MNKENYRELLPLVNDRDSMLKLEYYAQQRIDVLRSHLENQKEPQKIYELQGAIAELRRITTLREEVLTNSK